jgi:hypothetical protein
MLRQALRREDALSDLSRPAKRERPPIDALNSDLTEVRIPPPGTVTHLQEADVADDRAARVVGGKPDAMLFLDRGDFALGERLGKSTRWAVTVMVSIHTPARGATNAR